MTSAVGFNCRLDPEVDFLSFEAETSRGRAVTGAS